ncbi:kinase-like domain-containing protein [Phaeosphaeria sp. MPI-PUGE-AT-0046c]|nr:kinase-like domain-containing protein [Phaeosphaeria sp. MPI-PUGE-AT-0046c]
MKLSSDKGCTALIYRVKEGLVFKSPRVGVSEGLLAEIENAVIVKLEILNRLGEHSGIVRDIPMCRGSADKGLLFDEADGGDQQSWIDKDGNEINNFLREKWSLQIAKAVAYVHEKGVIHSNICPDNVLVQQNSLILADFGGYRCLELGLDSHLIPNPPLLNPHLTDFHTPKVDVFSRSFLLYVINNGQYLFRHGPVLQDEERFDYEDYVHRQLNEDKFPNLSGVPFKDVIAGCCSRPRELRD